MQQLELECEGCGEPTLHDVLKAQTSQKRGFHFQGTVRCAECGATRHAEIRESPPLELELRLSEGGETVREKLLAEPGDRLQVGELLSHARGPLEITALELGARRGTASTRRVEQAEASEQPIVWARLVTTVRVRFAVHTGHETLSLKQELPPETELAVEMVLQLDGRAAVIEALLLRGGRRVTKAAAWDLKRVTCHWKQERRGKGGRRGESQRRPRTNAERSNEARRRLARGGDHVRREGRRNRKG
ncbi:MAG: hypothetical protein CL960_03285 [Euryarchaeota archaeon]|jgi:uncharacterized Zn finger protein|nr:hypothetical protein [Euryarchaeota archaeon]MDP6364064.1 HVO_0476 family zinc finger protein [Candidatus Poseidoniia archaeon]MDP6658453.1 HVO_0476 family zinc finger protein [Candidatus Poseidoniia archaeon]MDP6846394.1 HVO_0476 family zinc finger protein [Candidatus Poseidoniia archaeon]MDP7007496.1 HVO_0476 family zinc finger protein [Candidatus Poseidoniia archaeon]|tara:strand:- start:1362 stop:2102 length:741 start_codon:yes stop_codon:yes gene_type:complete